MRFLKTVALAAVCVLAFSMLLSAGQKLNQYGVADDRIVNFSDPVRVGEVLLPSGRYEVMHSMQGDTHMMVFKQIHKKNPAEARVRCQLVPLSEKAPQDQKIYVINAAGERVLHTLIFRGDTAQHQF